MVARFSLCKVEALQQAKISGGNIAEFQSVNRGTVEKAYVKVDGGNIDKFYVSGEIEDSTVTGTINNVETNLIGGNINTLNVGTSISQDSMMKFLIIVKILKLQLWIVMALLLVLAKVLLL